MLTLSRNINLNSHTRKSYFELRMRPSNTKIKSCIDVEYFLTEHADEVRIKTVNLKYAESLETFGSAVFILCSMEFLEFYRKP